MYGDGNHPIESPWTGGTVCPRQNTDIELTFYCPDQDSCLSITAVRDAKSVEFSLALA